ncbi:hypothetical protein BY458DRAFT_519411 [Sporodiniella umbellata]|nr:hypothetical protein BY458DRAFT_519411 [Sporodiniella umbellata]
MPLLSTFVVNPHSVGLFACGILAGANISILYTSVPSIKASKDPLPVFDKTYNKGKIIAISNIFISTLSSAYAYHETKNQKYIYTGVLSFILAPITAFLIAPINNQLFALQKKETYDVNHVYSLVNRWETLHAIRAFSGLSAFFIYVFF